MFSILQKPQDSVTADDLETLQNQIEQRLVDVVTRRWKLERELDSLNNISPDTGSQPPLATNSSNDCFNSTKPTLSSSQPTNNLPSGKLRNSLKSCQLETQTDDASDGFKSSIFQSGHSNGSGILTSGTNSNETDSVSSDEGSLTSNLTSSTIIMTNLAEYNLPQSSNTTSAVKRGLKSSTSDRPSKRFRQNSSNSVQSTGSSYPKRPHQSKHRSKILPSKFRNSTEESRPNKKQLYKNEAPDKLWPFVEQFCATPTKEQIKDLEDLIDAMDNDKDYYKVPASIKKEVMSKESPTKSDASSNVTNNKTQRKTKSKTDEEASLGALTQRLVSSFIEEVEDGGDEVSKSSSDASSPAAKKRKSKASKSIDVDKAKNLEKRIRQQLEECSILSQQDEIPFTSEEDEILRELLAYQHELLSIQTENKHSMQLLLKKAKRHSELEVERERLREASADVIAAYQRLILAKQRKRNPTKKEKDAAYKALKTHEVIFKKCDELYMIGLDRNNAS